MFWKKKKGRDQQLDVPTPPTVSVLDVLVHYGLYRSCHEIGGSCYSDCPLAEHSDHHWQFHIEEGGVEWWCFGCEQGGDVVDLIAQKEKIPRGEADKLLQKWSESTEFLSGILRKMR